MLPGCAETASPSARLNQRGGTWRGEAEGAGPGAAGEMELKWSQYPPRKREENIACEAGVCVSAVETQQGLSRPQAGGP